MNLTQLKVTARRKALECLVRYNDKMRVQDVVYALNVVKNTVNKDVAASDLVWHQDDYLYYGDRL